MMVLDVGWCASSRRNVITLSCSTRLLGHQHLWWRHLPINTRDKKFHCQNHFVKFSLNNEIEILSMVCRASLSLIIFIAKITFHIKVNNIWLSTSSCPTYHFLLVASSAHEWIVFSSSLSPFLINDTLSWRSFAFDEFNPFSYKRPFQ